MAKTPYHADRTHDTSPEPSTALGVSHVFWCFGYSGAGKSTLGDALTLALRRRFHREVLRLDGDRLRRGVCTGLGFADANRTENLRRAAEIARLGVESGLVVVASFITPREVHRRLVREIVGPSHISFIHVSTPIGICRARDAKGLYGTHAARPAAEDVDYFEAPLADGVGLRLDAGTEDAGPTADRLVDFALRTLQTRPTVPKF